MSATSSAIIDGHKLSLIERNLKPGCVGLVNTGNTCFMNSGLQCLLCNPSLAKYFLEEFKLDDINRDTQAGCLARLFQKCWSGKFNVVRPEGFKSLPVLKDFRENQQQDCQEFLQIFLNNLHEFLNESTNGYIYNEASINHAQSKGNDEDSSESGIFMSDRDVCREVTFDLDGMDDVNIRSVVRQCTSEDGNLSDAEDSNFSCSVDRSCTAGDHKTPAMAMKILTVDNGNSNKVNSINNEESLETNIIRNKVPSFEDIYMKDARTLNTNVQLFDDFPPVTTDSEKFQKPLNISRSGINEESDKDDASFIWMTSHGDDDDLSLDGKAIESNRILDDLYKKSSSMRIKETNIMSRASNVEKHPEGKKLLLDADQPDINNIKRIKIDDDSRQTKVNIVQNLPREPETAFNSRDYVKNISSGNVSQPEISDLESSNQSFKGQAMESWENFRERNRSIVIDTLYGQIQNTCKCSACSHTSVSFEPFMFLVLSVPCASEQQLTIIFMSRSAKEATKYSVLVDKNLNVAQLKNVLNGIIGEDLRLLLAEVNNHTIRRILDDQVCIKNIETTKAVLYAFEDSSFKEFPGFEGDFDSSKQMGSSNCSSHTPLHPEDDSPPSSVRHMQELDDDPVQEYALMFSLDEVGTIGVNSRTLLADVTLNNSNNSFNNMSSNDMRLDLNPDINWQHNELDDPMQLLLESDTNLGWNSKKCVNSDWRQQTADWVNNTQMHFSKDEEDVFQNNDFDEHCCSSPFEDKMSCDSTAIFTSRETGTWKSCAICLEEMTDNNLMVHPPCGGIQCYNCLKLSCELDNYGLKCPVCRSPVVPKRDYVQLSSLDTRQQLKILILHVMLRTSRTSEDGQMVNKLIGHPNIVRLPCRLSGQTLYSTIARVVPLYAPSKEYKVLLTDSEGMICARCSNSEKCEGCTLSRDSSSVEFQPGDHLVVHFSYLSEEEESFAKKVVDDPSVDKSKTPSPITLSDCFHALAQNELLDHESWYCSRCEKLRRVNKATTVSRFPDTLMIHLKRFEFHELSSTKIDCEVCFPMDGLDLSTYSSDPTDGPILYDLQSYVCHSGGTSYGHYTACTKHPITGEWFRYNDDNFKRREPSREDYAMAYILIYQRKNTSSTFEPPTHLKFDQEFKTTSNSNNVSMLKRGRTSSGSDLRPMRLNFSDDLGHYNDIQRSVDFYH